jgi:pimeloyl-ACP methyl ester carboxylesterase
LELGSHGYIVVAINHTYYSGITVFPDGRVVSNPELLTADRQWEQAEATVAQDVTFVIDQLEILDAGDPGATLTRGLDLDRIGLMGFSLGGESAVLAGSRDDRIDAIVNEDGVIVPASIPRVEQPLMFLSGQLLFPESGGPDYSVLIRGFDHPSFSDVVVLFPGIGRVVPSRSVKIVRAYVLAFFDEYLKGIDQPLLDGPSGEFPEADLTVNISE